MRKKRVFALGLAITIILAAAVLTASLFYSESGSRFLVVRLLEMVPARIDAGRISGTLGRGLSIEDPAIAGTGKRLSMRRVTIQCRPWDLWGGRIALEKLMVEGLELYDQRPDDPVDLTWPRLPGVLSWFRGGIAALEIRDIVWRRPNRDITVRRLQSSLDYSYGLVRLPGLLITTPAGKVTGVLQFHLTIPFLAAELKITPEGSLLPATTLRTDLRAPAGSLHLQGVFEILTAAAADRERFFLKGRVATTAHILSLSALSVTEKGRAGSLTGEGRIDLSPSRPRFDAAVKIADLDLSPEVGQKLILHGDIDIHGDWSSYRGRFHLRPRLAAGPSLTAAGDFSGDKRGLGIDGLHLAVGKGVVRGRATVAWDKEWNTSWMLQARNIDPSPAVRAARGVINADLDGSWRRSPGGVTAGRVTGRFLNSRLAGRQLTGKIGLRWEGEAFLLDNLEVRGDGFQVQARGDLRDRIDYDVRSGDLSRLLPLAGGGIRGQGWVRYRHRLLSGILTAAGKSLAWKGYRASSLTASLALGEGPAGELRSRIAVNGLQHDGGRPLQADLTVTGTKKTQELRLQFLAPEGKAVLAAAGVYDQGVWTGSIHEAALESGQHGALRLLRPAALVLSRGSLKLAPLIMAGPQGEQVELSALWGDKKQPGQVTVTWRELQLERLPRPVTDLTLTGRTTGRLQVERHPGRDGFGTAATVRLHGGIGRGESRLDVREGEFRLRWQEKGMEANGRFDLGSLGKVDARFSSLSRPSLSLPDSGTCEASLTDLDLRLINPLLPVSLRTEGTLSGRLEGKLLPGRRWDITGRAAIAGGLWKLTGRKGTLRFSQERLTLAWTWREEALRGDLEGELTDHGQLRLGFVLPVRAQYPVKINPLGAVQGFVKGEIREKGILGAVFPGTVRESHGRLAVDITAAGTWQNPRYEGLLRLSRAGGYVTATGIRLEGVEAAARVYPERIDIEDFSARSGPGVLKGRATISYGGGKIQDIRGSLEGERFQAAYLPELEILVSPRLTFSGTPRHLSVRGAVHVPEGRYTESRQPDIVRASKDVRIVNGKAKGSPAAPFPLDVELTVTLGERVDIKTRDIEGRFSGEMTATGKNLADLQTRGAIHIHQGYLFAANTKLPLERGHIYFKDKPFSLAGLDLLAVKEVGDVRAGFLVTGTIHSPVVTLYSVPSLPDQDVLAYIVFGTSYTGDRIQAATLLKSAGMFLAQGKSGGLEDSLRKSAGLEVGGVISPTRGRPGRTDMTTSLSTMGQYLSPQLYVGLARALFSDDILYVMKYSFSRRWEVETKAGRQSSIDVFYKLEFD